VNLKRNRNRVKVTSLPVAVDLVLVTRGGCRTIQIPSRNSSTEVSSRVMTIFGNKPHYVTSKGSQVV